MQMVTLRPKEVKAQVGQPGSGDFKSGILTPDHTFLCPPTVNPMLIPTEVAFFIKRRWQRSLAIFAMGMQEWKIKDIEDLGGWQKLQKEEAWGLGAVVHAG